MDDVPGEVGKDCDVSLGSGREGRYCCVLPRVEGVGLADERDGRGDNSRSKEEGRTEDLGDEHRRRTGGKGTGEGDVGVEGGWAWSLASECGVESGGDEGRDDDGGWMKTDETRRVDSF